jgi:aminoglycoside phosphotransferase (APT) family kinase protein
MPISVTKNKKNEQTIIRMCKKAFQDKEVAKIDELTEGFFNVAYNITLTDGSEVILKIAPSVDSVIMTHEINIMFSEVESMRKVAKETSVPIAEIIFYDNSHTVCDSDYFFMKKLRGKSFYSCMESMTQEQKDKVFYLMGKYTAMINSIKGSKFGYYGQPGRQGSNWFEVFKTMIEDTYYDANRKDIDLKVPLDRLMLLLDRDKEIFEQVKEPKLVHWDIWAGNVFVDEDKVTGLIDFERCLWADELMEVGFRTYDYEKAFFDGYGITGLSLEQLVRAEWYDIYLFLILCLECDYRLYDSRWAYERGTKMLLEWVEKKELKLKSN